MEPANSASNSARSIKSMSLGNALVALGLLPQRRLSDALDEQKRTGRRLGEILLQNNYVSEEDIAKVLAAQQGLPFVDVRRFELSTDLVRRLPEAHARRLRALLLEDLGDSYRVGVVDPANLNGQDELSRILGRPLELVVASPDQLMILIDRHYGNTEQLSEYAREVESDVDKGSNVVNLNVVSATVDDQEAPVVKFLQTIFREAAQQRVSDIHIESQGKRLVIRFRVDGALSNQFEADLKIGPPLIVRLKLMAGLDIAEKRLPQDGRLSLRLDNRQLDVRLSTLPTETGEALVMRLLFQSSGVAVVEDVGMPTDMQTRFLKAISAPYGIILATGPTGSGKTTTLYGALGKLNRPEVKILTAEDPIEYRIPGLSQVQINEKIGLTFPKVLRAFLRQDPDVMLVGEIRDPETAEIAVRAAMTGHLVLSTLHTNNAASTPTRLMDMGIPGYLLATTLRAVVAQRLLRTICSDCSASHTLVPDEHSFILQYFDSIPSDAVLRRGRGCSSCKGSGFQGRAAIFEFLECTSAIADALHRGVASDFELVARQQIGDQTIAHNGLRLVFSGETTVAEVMRNSVASE